MEVKVFKKSAKLIVDGQILTIKTIADALKAIEDINNRKSKCADFEDVCNYNASIDILKSFLSKTIHKKEQKKCIENWL